LADLTLSPRKILFSGASGMIGTALVRAAEAKQIQAFQLVRRKAANPNEISWQPQAPQPVQDLAALEGMDAAIHLSGANLSAHRWTPAYKREIIESRVTATHALVKTLKALKHPPSLLLSASATGIYGNRGSEVLTEEAEPSRGFIAETCVAWEAAAKAAAEAGIRVVHLRFSVVLSTEAGALARLLPIFRLGLGGKLGNGQQWMSWIALRDQVRAIFFLLDSPGIEGPVNLAAPNPVTNAEFTRALGKAVHRPAIIPAPAFALGLAFGEVADEVLLSSTRAMPGELLRRGFVFEHPDIDSALGAALSVGS
jgi:uncharacterized protein